MQKVIITGADGFVGSYTTDYFLARGREVLAIDLAPRPRRLKEHPLLKYMQCDLSQPGALLDLVPKGEYDTFVHFAWIGLTGSLRGDYDAQTANAATTLDVLNQAHALGCSRFVCAGSIMEYEAEAAIHAQGCRPGKGYTYGIGKLMAHGFCKIRAAELGIDLLWPILTNAYGVGEMSERFIISTLRKIINCEPLQFTAATQNYDFVYVTDVARAFYLIAERGKPFSEYVIGSGDAQPLRGFILEMLRGCGAKSEPLFGDVPFTGVNIPLSTFSVHDLSTDCGFTPEVSFAEGTRRTMEWLKTVSRVK